jgi:hypothetical protein
VFTKIVAVKESQRLNICEPSRNCGLPLLLVLPLPRCLAGCPRPISQCASPVKRNLTLRLYTSTRQRHAGFLILARYGARGSGSGTDITKSSPSRKCYYAAWIGSHQHPMWHQQTQTAAEHLQAANCFQMFTKRRGTDSSKP